MNVKMIGLGVAALAGLFLLSGSSKSVESGGKSIQRFGKILGSPAPAQGDGGGGGVSPVGTYVFPAETFKGFAPLNLWEPDLEAKRPNQRTFRSVPAYGLPSKKETAAAMGGVPSEAPASVRHMLGTSILKKSEGMPASVRQMLGESALRKGGYSPGSGVVVSKKNVKETPSYKKSQAYTSGRVKVGKGMNG